MPNKLLITAFKPFALGGTRNASQSMMSYLRSIYGDKLDYLELEVSCSGINEFIANINTLTPSGIFSMGQSDSTIKDVVVEPLAHDVPPAIAKSAVFSSMFGSLYQAAGGGEGNIESSFSAFLKGKSVDHFGKTTSSSIGYYYCNELYKNSLTFAKQTNTPAIFIHVPKRDMFGYYSSRHQQQVVNVLEAMMAFVDR